MLDEVQPGEGAVAVDARIGDVAVEHGLDLDPAAPAERSEHRFLRGQVRVAHVDEAGVGDAQAAAFGVVEEHAAGERSGVQVQQYVAVAQSGVVGCEPVAGRCTLGQAAVSQGGPVRQPDHVLVGNRASADGGGEPVVAAGEVGPRVVDVVGDAFGR